MPGAGEITLTKTFKLSDFDALSNARLKVTIFVDLSHNQNIVTCRYNSPKPGTKPESYQKKAIELDMEIAKGTADETSFKKLKDLAADKAAREIYDKIVEKGGFAILKNPVTVEAPNFDTDIVNLDHSPSLRNPLQAVKAANEQAFMGLPDKVRLSMGMYQRGTTSTEFTGPTNTEPRARVAPVPPQKTCKDIP